MTNGREYDADMKLCESSDFHPYACGELCIHCEKRTTASHDPEYCFLCHDGNPPKRRSNAHA